MGLSSNVNESFKKHIYSIVTAAVIALLTFGYLSHVLPNNERKENAKNISILEGIEKHLVGYIDDQVKYISEDKMKSLKLSQYKGSANVYIDTIFIDKKGFQQLQDGTIKLSRTIKLSGKNNFFKNRKLEDSIIKDYISIDLVKFLNKINSTTHFTSFYLCPIEKGKCRVDKSFLSQNVSLIDQDSLIKYNRKNGPFSFKKSSKHYYTDQIKIPHTNHTLFLAAGIEKSVFDLNVRQINSNLLIFSLISIIVLILGINFIKPIISSYKERLSQIDLVGVVFSIGLLVAVIAVFAALSYWNNTIKTRNTNDLEQLVNKIDTSFKEQITAYQSWKKRDLLFGKEWKNQKNSFAKIFLVTGSKKTAINGELLTKKDSLPDDQKCFINGNTDFKKGTKNAKLIKYLDGYFRMDNKALITKNLSNNAPDISRKYADRMYFKALQQKNIENKKTEPVLTAVFSRENNRYQLIYAEKDTLKEINQESESNGIKGIAFREYFSNELELPPGTGYMLIDKDGDVLMQNDPKKNIYQNLLYVSQNNPAFVSLLAGVNIPSFEMEYMGIPYQICAKKLGIKTESPVYILAIRDLSHTNRLSIFTFTNGFLISFLYGFFILLINYIYSTFLYNARIGTLSKHHFYYLFPDSSRTNEYKKLLIVNCVSIVLALIVAFKSSPSLAFIFCIVLGVNVAFINLITLNIRTLNPKNELIKLVLILFLPAICLPMILFFYYNVFIAALALFGTHILLIILYYKNWRKRQKTDLSVFAEKNKGVNRRAYTRFLTARLLYQFVVFPFVLVSAFYVNELNDFARYYCSSLDAKEQKIKDKNDFIIKDRITNAYNCNCKEQTKDLTKDQIMQKANLGFFDRPASYEIKNFAFNELSPNYYLNLQAILHNGNNSFSFLTLFFLLVNFFFLTALAYKLLNYYSNRFFFYDLMQAYYEKYYPCTKNELANDHIFIPMVNDYDIKKLIQIDHNSCEIQPDKRYTGNEDCPEREISIDQVFHKDKKNEISPYLRMDFILNINHRQFCEQYEDVWESLSEETQYVLFDFAQDHFVNYKNKDTLINLMERGIIDCHQLTGRLKMMGLSFRIFILSKSKRDELFVQKFKDESKNGTYSKLKFPIIIIAVSALVLLMYLNKDSYDQVTLMGGSVVTVLALINKILDANKSL